MPDWSTVAVAGISAGAGVVGSAVGYLGARLQARVGLDQVEAEADRLRAVHDEEHLRHRQGVYHEFLDVEQRFLAMVSREDDYPRDVYDAWLPDYHHTYNGTILFGTDGVRVAAQALNDVHFAVHTTYLREVGTFARRFGTADVANQVEYRERRRETIDAMRADVAPLAAEVRS